MATSPFRGRKEGASFTMTNTNQPRGMRNNNPLNIRHSASQWQGVRAEQTDKAFVQFTSMAMGYRAAWRIFETYYKHFEARRQPFTPRNIIYRWAPPEENDSEAYLRSVCGLANLAGNAPLVRPSHLAGRDARLVRPQNPPSPLKDSPLLNDAYTANDAKAQTNLINLIAAMTCIENGISMKDVDRGAIETGLNKAFD